ncbi:MFS transporter [Actinoplanes teichomyceticus]|uniref:Putative MFS family arabinose efflux permease n=1 Tax=Actinoplanes teichomyceticus TaxID=1867 RepID=A0A561WSE1_ACTTI|nr:MFS transporter [Actinoplanes teichomyceticus]TWG26790.1 putative MFS family arabinose efflux permease [Actinoplanes teichomyceticus]GIF15189.1 MFS transporter [Actinoplanes teichomyceticus]
MRAVLDTTFRSLRVRNYRLFAGGQLIKLIGVWMMFTAQDWLVLELSDDSPGALGVVTALQFVPVMLLTLYSGRLADRYDKRKLLIVANAVFAVTAIAFAVLVAAGVVQLWHVFLFALLLGIANAVETPVRQAFVSELVELPLLPNALALSAATFNSARIGGPALAGVLLSVLSTRGVFLIATVLAVAPVFTYLRMNTAELYGIERKDRGEARVLDGLRYVGRRADLLLPICLMAAIGMIGFNFPVTLAALAKINFHAGASSFGLLTTALAVGALGGALAGSGRRTRPGAYRVIGAALAFGVLEFAVGFAPNFVVAMLLLVPTGFFSIYLAQAANHRVQMGVDADYRGRVMALYVLVFLGTTPIGATLAGWWGEHFGVPSSIWMGGLISFVASAAALAWQLRSSGDRLELRMRPHPRIRLVAAARTEPEAETPRSGVRGAGPEAETPRSAARAAGTGRAGRAEATPARGRVEPPAPTREPVARV